MTTDGLNALDLRYNYLNLLGKVESSADSSPLASYKWLADGTKAGATTADGTFGLEYIGSLIYRRNANNELELESTAFGGGRINKASNAYEVNYFIADHLSSTRVVVKPTISGIEVVERNNFLPFGKLWEQPGSVITDNRFRYSGKEEQHLFSLPYNDYGARMRDPRLVIWNGPDPLAEISRRWTPYNYAYNNPLRYTDPDGRLAGDFLNEKGRFLGSDGKTDGKLYVVKTTESSFGEGGSKVDGAGLSKNDAKATADFITENSGKKEAFANNPIAYNNSVEIEGSAENRQAMVTEVSKDNGLGGTADANNREYGGSMKDGKFVPATPGDVANPLKDSSVSITLPGGTSTAHSHPSGTATDGTKIGYFIQHPSQADIQTAGSNTHYVFGMTEGTVYIYNSGGVQATLPKDRFVTPKR